MNPWCGNSEEGGHVANDAASEPNAREANQQSAPAVERGLFLVPKVIE